MRSAKGTEKSERLLKRALPESIALAGRDVPLRIRRNPSARRIVLRIDVEAGGVSLTLPGRTAIAEGLKLAHDRADWVIRCLDKLPARVAFEDGATISLLGRDTLIRHAPAAKHGVAHVGDELIVAGRSEYLARRVADWLKREARREITQRAHPMAARIDQAIAAIAVRDTRSRWGSCTPDKKLSFCWRLILTPEWVMDYVVAHEVAHLRHMDHSAKFWATVTALGVNPQQARAWLDVHAERLQRIG